MYAYLKARIWGWRLLRQLKATKFAWATDWD